MRRSIFFVFTVIAALALAGCSSSRGTLEEVYPEMYGENPPISIIVMPPINKTTNVDAKEYYYSTLHRNLADDGYYVFPSFLSMQTLQNESAYDSELFLEGDISKFATTFGADLLLFTTINSWKKSAVMSDITVGITYTLRSTATGNTVYMETFTYKYTTTQNTFRQSLGSIPFGFFIGWAIDKSIALAKVGLTDYVRVARSCNYFGLSTLPAGKYSPNAGTDGGNDAGSGNRSITSPYLYN